jgi:GH24 family phage-related lysozyme (muramidase)
MSPEVEELASSLAKPFERFFSKAYWDPHPDGLPTQGWGRLLSRYSLRKHLEEGKTREQAYQWLQLRYPPIDLEIGNLWLAQDLAVANNGVRNYVKVPLTPQQEAALTDFAFNLGVGNLQISTLLRLLNRGDYMGAAGQFRRWNLAGGKVLPGLTRRREAERVMFLS